MRRFKASHVAQRCRFIDRRIRLVLYGSILLETLGLTWFGYGERGILIVCFFISDSGLKMLAKGSVSRTLKKLLIAECGHITDMGELNLACCGSVTDVSVVALGAIQTEEIELVLPECIRRYSGGVSGRCGAAGEQKPGLEVHQTECVDANGDARESWQILQVGLDFGVRDGGCSGISYICNYPLDCFRKGVKVLQEFRRKDKEHDFVMEKLGDDELGLIINWVHDHNDRKSISQVCKQWLRVEGQTRLYIRVLEAEVLHNFLSRFPNLVTFQASGLICNAHLECVAQTCPKIEVLNLNTRKMHDDLDESDELSGLNGGIHAIANGCRELRKVYLRRRGIGNFGVVSLLNFGKNLTELDLGRCNRITDQALEAIGYATSLCVLNLRCCWLITDSGLAMLANGSTARTLKKLIIAECERITDYGLSCLQQMCCLEELNLAECGPAVTDIGGVAVASIPTLKWLNLSWLINISDVTLTAIAEHSQKLMVLDLTGCELITGEGVRAFVDHESLEELVLVSCVNVFQSDVELLVLGSQSLKYIKLDKRLRMWIPIATQENISRFCRLDWSS
ncbi:hypothetical protein AAG906_002600 [Vitis piasezkii]